MFTVGLNTHAQITALKEQACLFEIQCVLQHWLSLCHINVWFSPLAGNHYPYVIYNFPTV